MMKKKESVTLNMLITSFDEDDGWGYECFFWMQSVSANVILARMEDILATIVGKLSSECNLVAIAFAIIIIFIVQAAFNFCNKQTKILARLTKELK